MRFRMVVLLSILAAWLLLSGDRQPTPAPTPPPGELDLAGAFIGETAADDAAIVAALAGELADCIEYDQMQAEPVLTTGLALDNLRTQARLFRCDGRSLGEVHPELARRVGSYLDSKLGNAGGPVSPEQLAKWITAYREIERAASRVIR
jgi:hypothetical protein